MRRLRKIFIAPLATLVAAATLFATSGTAGASDWVSVTGPAEGVCEGYGSEGIITGCFLPTFAVSGTGTAGAYSCWQTAVALSLLGAACAAPDGRVWLLTVDGAAVSGTGTATSDWIAVSGLNNATGPTAVSGTGNAYGAWALSFAGNAYGSGIAISGTGAASGGLIGISATGDASGQVLAVSGTGHAYAQVPFSGIWTVYTALEFPDCNENNQGEWIIKYGGAWQCRKSPITGNWGWDLTI